MTNRKRNPHRGPSKADKRSVTVHLTEDEYTRLIKLAEEECRSATQQAVYLIRRGLVEVKPKVET